MFFLPLIFASLAASAAIVTQDVSIALIAAVSSIVNTVLALHIRVQAVRNAEKIDLFANRQRIVITHTDKGLMITDEDMRALEPRGDDWEWPLSR